MSRVYLDASPVIFMVQQVMPYWVPLQTRLSLPGIVLVASELTRLECLVLPLRAGDAQLIGHFDSFFATQVAELVPFTAAVFRRAAEIRARHNYRTPDALHLASAVEGACDVFLTNDARLAGFTDIKVDVA
jgi:uncharacterized protein